MPKSGKFLIIAFVYFINSFCQAQNKNVAIGYSHLLAYNLIPYKSEITNESLSGLAQGFELSITKQTNGSKEWHKTYGMPRIGIGFQTIQMNKPEVFGVNFSIQPFIQLRLFTFEKAEINAKIAFGLGTNTKLFDQETNINNRAVSLPISFANSVGAVYNKKLSKHFDLNIELGYYHLSNGNLKIPNGGFHVYMLKGGFNYFLDEVPYANRKKPNTKLSTSKWYYSTYAAVAYKELGTFADPKRFYVFTWHHAYMKPITKTYHAGVGLDLFYDASPYLRRHSFLSASDVSNNDKLFLALGFCNELRIGQFALPLQVYRYLYDNTIVNQHAYVRFGLTHNPFKNLLLGCYFKGGFTSKLALDSDFVEFAIGWQFINRAGITKKL